MNQVKHDGIVIKVYPDCMRVIINRGSNHGVQKGFRYLVFGLGEELVDPETGKSLGIPEDVRGRGIATHVQEEITTVASTERVRTRRILKHKPEFWMTGLSALKSTGEEVIEEDVITPFADPCEGDYVRDVTTSQEKSRIRISKTIAGNTNS